MTDAGSARGRWRYAAAAVFLAVILVLAGLWWADSRRPDDAPEGCEATVEFLLDSGALTIFCEVADTPEEQALGLMYREELPEDAGMLFVFEPPREVSFWMKNTLIPLDMVFINSSGFVVGYQEAFPEPDTPDALLTRYPSPGPVKWVVEMNQGICAGSGIDVGTEVLVEYLA